MSDFYGNILPNAAAATIAPFLISAGRPVVAPSLLFAETTRQSPFSNLRGEEEKERERETRRKKKRDVRTSGGVSRRTKGNSSRSARNMLLPEVVTFSLGQLFDMF